MASPFCLTAPTDFDKFFDVFLLRVSLGFLLVGLGLGYLFQPRAILRLNALVREKVFRDAYVLLKGRRVGAALLTMGLLLLIVTLRFSR